MLMTVHHIRRDYKRGGYIVTCKNEQFDGTMSLRMDQGLPSVGDSVWVDLKWRNA